MGVGEFEKRRGSREQFESKQLGEQQLHHVGPRWVISCLARVMDLNVRTEMSRTATLSLGPAAGPGTRTGPARKRSCRRGVTSARVILTV